uniref:WAS/WASL-interacting protein family member 3-like n=1 Tax=Fundulus heteroclitus TaxID=8078 RepID=A0A3Q2PJZ1_FUNHE
MPAPPPPPPPPLGPPPPPPPTAALPQCPLETPQLHPGRGGGRNALLADIQKGAKLRRVTQVNDRSAPAVDELKSNTGDVGASQSSSAGMAPTAPAMSGLFAGGFPTLKPIGHRDLAGKTSVSRSSSAVSLRPQWNPPASSDSSCRPESHKTPEIQNSFQRLLTPSASAPPSPSHSSKHPPPFPAPPPPPPPPAPPSVPPPPPPPQAFQDRPAFKPPALPSCPPPPPPPPSQITRPTWLPVQHSHHASVTQPSTPPPPPPPLTHPLPSSMPGDRSSGYFFYSPPPAAACSEPSRFPILRDSPLGPPPPPPPPPLPTSFTPSCPTSLPPPPPKTAPVSSPAMRSLPPSYPCSLPMRRPPAVPRSLGVGRLLAPPPPPPARSPNTELTTRTLPPPPPPPPFSLRNGHHSPVDDFESKFQFHPEEDLPPPDEFKPFPRVYPSKENRVNPKPPGTRTHLR